MHTRHDVSRRASGRAGFTLIELLIVVAVVGILGAIAFPSYTQYVIRGKRAEGRTALMDAAALQERFYSDCNRYGSLGNSTRDCGAGEAVIGTTSENGKYNLTVNPASPTTTYTLKAAPTFADTECGTLTLTNAGTKGMEGGSTTDVKTCWGK